MRALLPLSLVALAACERTDTPPNAENAAVPAPPAKGTGTPGNAVAPEPATPVGRASAIPTVFQGRWAGDAAGCSGPRDEMALSVTGDALRFYESEGRVETVDIVSPREASVEASFTGEGESWRDTRRMTLSEDGQKLTIDIAGTSSTRVRCD